MPFEYRQGGTSGDLVERDDVPIANARYAGTVSILLPGLLAGVLLLANLGGRKSLDGHEVLVAQTAREMVRSGDWLVPHFAGEVRLQKPPLAYWLTALAYRLTGSESAFAARLPSAMATLVGVLFLTAFVASWIDIRLAFVTGLVQATTFWTIAYGKLALVDATLTTLTMVGVLLPAYDRLSPRWIPAPVAILAFWILNGLAVLAKGPTTLVIVFATAIVYRGLRERCPSDGPFFLSWWSLAGLGIFAIEALAWPIAVARVHPEAATVWQAQSVDRFMIHWGTDGRPWFYYAYIVPALALPWSPAVVWLGRECLQRDQGRRRGLKREHILLLGTWFLLSLAWFTVSAGKREHYILPGLPPLSIFAALGLLTIGDRVSRSGPIHPNPLRWMAGAGAIGAAAGLWAEIALGAPGMTIRGLLLGTTLVGAGFAFAPWLRGGCRPALSAQLIGFAAASILVFEFGVLPTFHFRSANEALLARQRTALDRAPRVLQFGSNDRWTAFPVDRPMAWPRTIDDVALLLQLDPSALLLVPRERLHEVSRITPIEVIDGVGSSASAAERNPRLDLVLVRPVPIEPSRVAGRPFPSANQATR